MTPTTTTTNPIYSGTEPSTGFIDFLLHRLRIAGLRARIIVNEIDTTTVALSAGMISAETALLHLHETGALALVPTSSAWGMQ